MFQQCSEHFWRKKIRQKYRTVEKKTVRANCFHCSFSTPEVAVMLDHNKTEHPEL
jgi:hypothetical protein